jgi:uncharacterized membrane protein
MAAMKALEKRVIRFLTGRWDLAILAAYAITILLLTASSQDISIIWSSPLIFIGCGYPLTLIILKGRLLSLVRGCLSILLSSSLALTLFLPLDVGEQTMVLAITALCAIVSVIQMRIRTLDHQQEVRSLGASLLRHWDGYISRDVKKRYIHLATVTIFLMLVYASWSITTSSPPSEKYTEFYVTGPDGFAESIPREIVTGTNYTVIVGLANHEKRTINYDIQVWLVQSKTEDNYTNVTKAFYVNSFATRLLNTEPSSGGEWKFQWESRFTFNINVTGTYKLWFLLSKNGAPEFETNLTKLVPYEGDRLEELINQARLFEVQSLNINLVINEPIMGLEANLTVAGRADYF